MSHQQFREANRLSWNDAIQARNRHKGDDATFFREGGNTLDPEERAFLEILQDHLLFTFNVTVERTH